MKKIKYKKLIKYLTILSLVIGSFFLSRVSGNVIFLVISFIFHSILGMYGFGLMLYAESTDPRISKPKNFDRYLLAVAIIFTLAMFAGFITNRPSLPNFNHGFFYAIAGALVGAIVSMVIVVFFMKKKIKLNWFFVEFPFEEYEKISFPEFKFL